MSRILESDLKDFACRFHRNGVAGEGFHLCRFVWREGRISRLMFATVFDHTGRIAVHSQDIAERWRGDDFEDALRASIKRFGDRAYEHNAQAVS